MELSLQEIIKRRNIAFGKLFKAIEERDFDLIQEYRKDLGHWLLREQNLGKTYPIIKVSFLGNTNFIYVTGMEDLGEALELVKKSFPELNQDEIIIQKIIPMKLY
jgi:hypothetical protein